MSYENKEEIIERIEAYYTELLTDILPENEVENYFKSTFEEVLSILYPYAKDKNYWWEEKSIKMAYYQLKHDVLVVDYDDYTRYYKKLMGRKYDAMELATEQGRQKIIEESEEKYNKKRKR